MMIRLASTLVLVALALLAMMLNDTTGEKAILFSFVGMPALGAAIVLYALARRGVGAGPD